MTELPVVVGITGPPCAGKDVIKDYLLEIARGRRLRTGYLSFSGVLLEEAQRRVGGKSEPIDRERITEIAWQLREEQGDDVLACIIVGRIEQAGEEGARFYVVEALRHPAEAQRLEDAFGSNFFLIAVTAPVEELVRRLTSRARSDESPGALRSPAAARELVERELNGDGSPHSINVSACMSRADALIENDGTLPELRAKVEAVFRRIIQPPSRS